MLSLFGSGIGRGIAIGPAYALKNSDIETQQVDLDPEQIPAEVKRFKRAVSATEKQYKKYYGNFRPMLPRKVPHSSTHIKRKLSWH